MKIRLRVSTTEKYTRKVKISCRKIPAGDAYARQGFEVHISTYLCNLMQTDGPV